eukprot:2817774-Amphidinium_carterae.1
MLKQRLDWAYISCMRHMLHTCTEQAKEHDVRGSNHMTSKKRKGTSPLDTMAQNYMDTSTCASAEYLGGPTTKINIRQKHNKPNRDQN